MLNDILKVMQDRRSARILVDKDISGSDIQKGGDRHVDVSLSFHGGSIMIKKAIDHVVEFIFIVGFLFFGLGGFSG